MLQPPLRAACDHAGPGPSAAEIATLLKIASRVPDHGKLAPWRFIVFDGTARDRAGATRAEARRRGQPDRTDPGRPRNRARLFPARRLSSAVVSRAAPHVKIPEWEQVLSAGAACMALVLSAPMRSAIAPPGSPNGAPMIAGSARRSDLPRRRSRASSISAARRAIEDRPRPPLEDDRHAPFPRRRRAPLCSTRPASATRAGFRTIRSRRSSRPGRSAGFRRARKDGRINLAPYSFFNGFSSAPPIVGFSSEGLEGFGRFRGESGEFVANLATMDLAHPMNASSAALPRGENEFDHAGLTMAPCRLVAAPRVAESHASLECMVTLTISLIESPGAQGSTAI